MRLFILSFLIIILISSCNQNSIDPEQFILGNWKLYESKNLGKKEKSSGDALLDESKKIEDVKIGKLIAIFPNHTYTEIIGEGEKYTFGSWSWVEVGTKISFKHGSKTETYTIVLDDSTPEKLQFELSNSNKIQKFVQESKLLEKFKEEPFYSENNLWRIKPNKAETKQQIIDRLGNYFKHVAYILKAADKRDLQVVSFRQSVGIVKIYNGGIGIHDFEIIPETWKNCFYNQEEALLAHELFSDYLQTDADFSGPGTGDWVKDDYTILLSIYNDLKTGQFEK